MPVQFFFNETRVSLKNRRKLKSFIVNVFKEKKKELVTLNYIFCTDPFLLEINQHFLNHDNYTDIISFDLSGKKGSIEGEVYISTDRLKENAKLNNTPVKEELHRLIFHGLLHLCGHNDKSTSDKRKMTNEENRLLQDYFSFCSTWNSYQMF